MQAEKFAGRKKTHLECLVTLSPREISFQGIKHKSPDSFQSRFGKMAAANAPAAAAPALSQVAGLPRETRSSRQGGVVAVVLR